MPGCSSRLLHNRGRKEGADMSTIDAGFATNLDNNTRERVQRESVEVLSMAGTTTRSKIEGNETEFS